MGEARPLSEAVNNQACNNLLAVPGADSMADGDVIQICSNRRGAIAVFRSEGDYFAVSNKCTHGDASLAEGWLEGYEIECPIHAGRFDIRTGAPLAFPVTEPLDTFPVRWVDGVLHVVIAQ